MRYTLTALLCLLTLGAFAAEPPTKPSPGAEPIRITARDGFEYDLKSRSAVYRGNVIVTDPAMKMSCDKLTVFFAATGKKEKDDGPIIAGNLGGRVERIEAEGRVVIQNLEDKSTAVGDRAVYTAKDQTVILSGGRPSIAASNGSIMSADLVIFDHQAGRFRMEGRIESSFSQDMVEGGSIFKRTNPRP